MITSNKNLVNERLEFKFHWRLWYWLYVCMYACVWKSTKFWHWLKVYFFPQWIYCMILCTVPGRDLTIGACVSVNQLFLDWFKSLSPSSEILDWNIYIFWFYFCFCFDLLFQIVIFISNNPSNVNELWVDTEVHRKQGHS